MSIAVFRTEPEGWYAEVHIYQIETLAVVEKRDLAKLWTPQATKVGAAVQPAPTPRRRMMEGSMTA